MERADGNRKMWLLKSTSGHHRPECLAAALALGILAGLVPKLNLLAVILYGLILILPVHTFLALVVSAGVALLSFQLDATAHSLGEYLLRQDSLRPLWGSLERTPIVPWMSLHNTVVLGHFVLGLVLLAPMYLISVRVFERIEYGRQSRQPAQATTIQSYAPVSTEEAEPLTKKETYRHRDGTPDQRTAELPSPQESTVDRSPLIIPPPKLHRVAAEADSESRLNGPDEPILFEPVADDGQRMGAWHMNHATGEAQYASSSRSPNANAQSATAKAVTKAAGSAKSASPTPSSDSFFPQISEAYSVESSLQQSGQTLPIAPTRPEGVLNSLELAQNTSEVLAWVDDLLDECMAAEGMALVSQDYDQSVNSTEPRASSSSDTDAMVGERSTQPRWLLETTIEIVRLTDDTMSDQLFVAEQSMNGSVPSDSPETRSMESSKVMPAESMTRAWPGVGGAAIAPGSGELAVPAREPGEPTILNLSQASARNRTDPRTGFQQIVMAGVLKDSVGKELEQRPTLPIEPVKGECLAYLLGHLRQSREGKST